MSGTGTRFIADPQFAGAAIIPSSQKLKEEMYFFFSEFNKTARVDEEPYRARIGRVCTVRSPSGAGPSPVPAAGSG